MDAHTDLVRDPHDDSVQDNDQYCYAHLHHVHDPHEYVDANSIRNIYRNALFAYRHADVFAHLDVHSDMDTEFFALTDPEPHPDPHTYPDLHLDRFVHQYSDLYVHAHRIPDPDFVVVTHA